MWRVITSCVTALLCCNSPLIAVTVPYNGDFSTGLDGWTVVSGSVSDGGGFALFQEHSTDILSTLRQEFFMPDGVIALKFDVKISATAGGETDAFAWPDAITASLLNAVTLEPVVSNPARSDFFYIDNTDSIITLGAVTITTDIRGFDNQDVVLYFDMIGGNDGMLTTASIDNVEVVIPEPCSFLLLLGGAGTLGFLRRLRV